MPGGDRTGPFGYGPMTGRAAGFCAGYGVPGYLNPVYGFGCRSFGRGRGGGFGGGGRGWRNRFYATGMTGWQRAAVGMPGLGSPLPWAYPPAGAPLSSEQEVEALKNQAAYLENALKDIKRQIEEISSKNPEE